MKNKKIGLVTALTVALASGAQANQIKDTTKQQIDQIHAETNPNHFSFDVKGAENYIQSDLSFINGNKGLGVQLTHNERKHSWILQLRAV